MKTRKISNDERVYQKLKQILDEYGVDLNGLSKSPAIDAIAARMESEADLSRTEFDLLIARIAQTLKGNAKPARVAGHTSRLPDLDQQERRIRQDDKPTRARFGKWTRE